MERISDAEIQEKLLKVMKACEVTMEEIRTCRLESEKRKLEYEKMKSQGFKKIKEEDAWVTEEEDISQEKKEKESANEEGEADRNINEDAEEIGEKGEMQDDEEDGEEEQEEKKICEGNATAIMHKDIRAVAGRQQVARMVELITLTQRVEGKEMMMGGVSGYMGCTGIELSHYTRPALMTWSVTLAGETGGEGNNGSGLNQQQGPNNFQRGSSYMGGISQNTGPSQRQSKTGRTLGQNTNERATSEGGNGGRGARFRRRSPEEMAERWLRNPIGYTQGSSTQNFNGWGTAIQSSHDGATEVTCGGERQGARFRRLMPEKKAEKQDTVRTFAEVYEHLLPNIFIVIPPRKDLGIDIQKLISLQLKEHIFTESNKLIKSSQEFVELQYEFLGGYSNGGSFTSIITWSVCFKQWDPGGSSLTFLSSFFTLRTR